MDNFFYSLRIMQYNNRSFRSYTFMYEKNI